MGSDPWMHEIDTAIDGYDVYVDRLTNAAAGTDRNTAMTGWGGLVDTFGLANNGETGNGQGMNGWGQGLDLPNGMQDWDWGTML